MSEPYGAPSMRDLRDLFQPLPLSRSRAFLSLLLGTLGLLCFAGMLSYATGSPDTPAHASAPYWALFFGLYFVGLGGAAVLGAFPRLAQGTVKLVWLVSVALLYVLTVITWHHLRPAEAPAVAEHWRALRYAPLLAVLAIGLWWKAVRSQPSRKSEAGTSPPAQ